MMQNSKYVIRDPEGNIFGPADEALLRRWAIEGRIIAGILIAPQNTQQWVDAAQHPAVADLISPPAVSGPYEPGGITPASDRISASSSPRPTAPIDLNLTYTRPPRLNMPALFGFICGTLGILSLPPSLCCCVTIFLGPIGILADLAGIGLGIWALWQMRAEPARFFGRGLAIMGIVLGGLSLVIGAGILASLAISSMLHH